MGLVREGSPVLAGQAAPTATAPAGAWEARGDRHSVYPTPTLPPREKHHTHRCPSTTQNRAPAGLRVRHPGWPSWAGSSNPHRVCTYCGHCAAAAAHNSERTASLALSPTARGRPTVQSSSESKRVLKSWAGTRTLGREGDSRSVLRSVGRCPPGNGGLGRLALFKNRSVWRVNGEGTG